MNDGVVHVQRQAAAGVVYSWIAYRSQQFDLYLHSERTTQLTVALLSQGVWSRYNYLGSPVTSPPSSSCPFPCRLD